MKSSLKKIKDCKVRLQVEVEPKLVEERYQHVLRDFQKAAHLPGFREGKAPDDLVEKRYAKEIQEELLKSLVPEAYHQSVASQKVSPVSLPAISGIQWERGKKLTFAAEFEQAPEFSLKNTKGIKLKKVPADVHAADIEKGISALLDAKSELVPLLEPRTIQKGDFIITDIEMWQGGQYAPGRKNVLLHVEPGGTDDFCDKVVGAQVEDVREVSVDPSEEEKKQGLVGRKPLYKLWIRAIKEKRQPALDDEFAKAFGKETLEELREAVRKDITSHKRAESFEKMREELFGKLLALASFTIPQSLIDRQQERLLEQAHQRFERSGGDHAAWEREKEKITAEASDRARDQVKLYFILQKVADGEGIEVDEMALQKRLEALAGESKRPLEEVRRVFEDDVRESMRETKTVDFLLANAKLEETT
ncbi:MAG: trigger factor [Candidatus Omnitrophota bacterium]